MYYVAVILDPRLRMVYFEAKGWEDVHMAEAKAAVLKVMQAYREEASSQFNEGCDDDDDDEEEEEAQLGSIRHYSKFAP